MVRSRSIACHPARNRSAFPRQVRKLRSYRKTATILPCRRTASPNPTCPISSRYTARPVPPRPRPRSREMGVTQRHAHPGMPKQAGHDRHRHDVHYRLGRKRKSKVIQVHVLDPGFLQRPTPEVTIAGLRFCWVPRRGKDEKTTGPRLASDDGLPAPPRSATLCAALSWLARAGAHCRRPRITRALGFHSSGSRSAEAGG